MTNIKAFGQFSPFSVGFDEMFNTLQRASTPASNYPPYNIIKKGEAYFIEMAIAGFKQSDIEIEIIDNSGMKLDIGEATSNDIVNQQLLITNDAPEVFPLGETIVTWTATDSSGNSASATQTIIILDTTIPTITAPSNVQVEAISMERTIVDYGFAQASDQVEVSSITNDAPEVFPLGETIVTWTATDSSGNSASATQTITVVDTTAPVIITPENVTSNATSKLNNIVELEQISATDSISTVQITNNTFEKYDFSEEEIKPYFSEDRVLQGAFDVASKLFDITFVERNDLPKYRDNIRSFEVLDEQNETIGIFYTDFTLRPNKGGGAWMNTFRSQSKFDGKQIPIVVNVCNFPPENEDGVSLLSFEQVETLFHEFGHGLHGLLSDANYPSLSGTSVTRDYVEFPSQMMENWAREPEVIKTFALHYKTDEPIPDSLLNKISEAGTFNEGFETSEYVAAAHLDMAYHTSTEDIKDIDKFEDDTLGELGLIPQIESRYRSTYFGHIFAGGYSSGYYSYLWTEVLEADAFEPFREKGLFDKETATKLKEYVYASGNTEDLMTQYINYRGSEPKIEPLLKKRGLD